MMDLGIDGLIQEWDKEHRARAIENGKVRSKTYQFSLFLICVLVLIKTSLYLQLVVAMRIGVILLMTLLTTRGTSLTFGDWVFSHLCCSLSDALCR